jgi:hypothetical protein
MRKNVGMRALKQDAAIFVILRCSGTESTITKPTKWARMMMNDDDCGAICEMLGRGNPSIRRKPAPVPLYPSEIPHDLSGARIRVAAVGSRRLKRLPGSFTSM